MKEKIDYKDIIRNLAKHEPIKFKKEDHMTFSKEEREGYVYFDSSKGISRFRFRTVDTDEIISTNIDEMMHITHFFNIGNKNIYYSNKKSYHFYRNFRKIISENILYISLDHNHRIKELFVNDDRDINLIDLIRDIADNELLGERSAFIAKSRSEDGIRFENIFDKRIDVVVPEERIREEIILDFPYNQLGFTVKTDAKSSQLLGPKDGSVYMINKFLNVKKIGDYYYAVEVKRKSDMSLKYISKVDISTLKPTSPKHSIYQVYDFNYTGGFFQGRLIDIDGNVVSLKRRDIANLIRDNKLKVADIFEFSEINGKLDLNYYIREGKMIKFKKDDEMEVIYKSKNEQDHENEKDHKNEKSKRSSPFDVIEDSIVDSNIVRKGMFGNKLK